MKATYIDSLLDAFTWIAVSCVVVSICCAAISTAEIAHELHNLNMAITAPITQQPR